jgi:predicted nuclease with TOPRIM domain
MIVALLAGGFFLYSQNKDKDAQLAKLTQDSAELDVLRQQIEDLKKQVVAPEELARLRKNDEEVLRLRGEAQRLRDQAKQLTGQVATAQAQATQTAQQAQQQAARLAAENESLRAQGGKPALTAVTISPEAQAQETCISFLRIIDGAKQTWALENKKAPTDVPTAADLAPYILPKDLQIACPSGGTYSINAVNQPPTCTIPGHALKSN